MENLTQKNESIKQIVKHYIDTYGLPTNDEIEVMNEIEKTILTQE